MVIGAFLIITGLLLLFLGAVGSYRLIPFLNVGGNSSNQNQSTAQTVASNVIASSIGGSHQVK